MLKVKQSIVKELNSKCSMDWRADRIRLRMKSYTTPLYIYTDDQIFGDDISLEHSREFFIQVSFIFLCLGQSYFLAMN